MQPVSRIAPAVRPPRARLGVGEVPASAGPCRGRCSAWRSMCDVGGGTKPAEARKDGDVPGEEEDRLGLAEKELEVPEEEAIGGGDEDRRPTDYDRRAHIFEESSRVFRALKHRRDGDGVKAAETTHDTNGST